MKRTGFSPLLAVLACRLRLSALAAWMMLATAFLAAPARAENVYIMDLNLGGIYSADVTTGGPATLLTTIPVTGQGYTLATRPSDGMLFFLDSSGSNPNLWRWDPNTPAQLPTLVGTPGANTTNVVRLGFDSAGNLLAMDTTSSMWTLDMNTGGIIGTTPLSGNLPTQSGDLCLNTTNGVLYMVANQQLYTVTSSGVSTLQGTISGIGTGTTALVTGCAFTRSGTMLISLYGGGRIYRVDLNTFAATALPQLTGVTYIGDLSSAPDRQADLSLTKTASNATPGSTVSFTVTVSNAGPARATDVRVLDQLPSGLALNSWTSSQGTYSTAASGAVPASTWRVGALAPGASATLTMNATVTGTTPITNTAQVSYSDPYDPDSTPNNNVATEDDQASVAITPSPDLQVTKVANGSFAVSANGVYTLTVKNAGSAATSGLYTVTDVLPAGLSYVSGTGTGWNCSGSGATVTCGSSTLIAPGATNPNAITLTVGVGAAAAPQVTNTATVSGGGEPASLSGNNTSSATTAVCDANCPDLTVNKTLSTNSLTVAGQGTYTLSVTNIGGLATSGLYTITDTLPPGLTLNAAPNAGTGWTCTPSGTTNTAGGTAVSCARSTAVAPGTTSPTVTFVVNVANAAVPQVTNTATVTGGGEPPATQGNNSASVTTPVVDFDLTITKIKTGGGNFQVGVNGSYTFTVNNVGGRVTTGAYTFTDTLPAGLTIASSSSTKNAWTLNGWNCGVSGTTNAAGGTLISCTSSTAINAGASSASVIVPVAVAAAAAPSVTNTATVTGVNEASALTGNNSSTITTPVNAVDLVVTKSHTGNFAVGVNGQYTLTASNIGLVATTAAVTVVDTLPSGLTFVSATGTNWTCTYAAPRVTCVLATAAPIAANDSAAPIVLTVTPTAAAASASPVLNTATVSGGNEPAGNNSNNSASDTTYVYNPPVLAKAFNPASVAPGAVSTLTLTITNPAGSGMASMQGLGFVDPFPAGMSVANPPSLVNTCGGSITSGGVQGDTLVVLSGGALGGPGTSCKVQVNVTASGIGAKVNTTGTVTSSNAGTGNTASATLTVTAANNPILTKITSPNPVSVGAPSTLTFTITNDAGTSTDMAFVDTLPAGVVIASGGTFGGNCTSTGGTAYSATSALSGGRVAITVKGVDLTANGSCTVTIPVTSNTTGSYANTSANISGLAGTLTATTVSDTLVVQAATLTKDFTPSSMLINQTSTMTLTISNTTEAPQHTGLAFTETLPAGLVLAAAPAASQCNGTVTGAAGGTTVTFSGGRLALGLEACTIRATVTSAVPGTYVNAAGNVTNLSADLINAVNATLVVTAPLPTLTNTDNRDSVSPGDTTTYVITVGNTTGSAFTNNVVLRDPAVANLTLGNVTCTAQGGATCPSLTSAQMISALQGAGLTIPLIPDGGSVTFSVDALVSGNPSGTLTNTATASVGSQSVSAPDVDNLVYPGLVVSKTVATLNDPVNGVTNPKSIPGAEMLYTVVVTNTGQGRVDTDSLQLTDPIPAHTSLFVGNLGGTPAGPVAFSENGSGLTYAGDAQFLTASDTSGNYKPTPDANGVDAAVNVLRVQPKGRMAGWSGSGAYPSFTFSFKVRVQ